MIFRIWFFWRLIDLEFEFLISNYFFKKVLRDIVDSDAITRLFDLLNKNKENSDLVVKICLEIVVIFRKFNSNIEIVIHYYSKNHTRMDWCCCSCTVGIAVWTWKNLPRKTDGCIMLLLSNYLYFVFCNKNKYMILANISLITGLTLLELNVSSKELEFLFEISNYFSSNSFVAKNTFFAIANILSCKNGKLLNSCKWNILMK